MFQYKTGSLSQHPQLFYQAWHPHSSPKGLVLIAHGFGGHGGQYVNAALKWVEAHWGVYVVDFRGHGKSEGQRGFIQQWEDYGQDLAALFAQAQQDYPNRPTMLWGHSLGGLIALDFAIQSPEQLSGLMLTAPAVGETAISPFKFVLGTLLSWIWPRFSLASGFDVNYCSRDPAQVHDYKTDPLRHSRGTARLSTEFRNAQARILNHLSGLQTPILILHGEGDRITCPEDSAALYQALKGGDRQMILYPEAYHNLHLDSNREQVLTDMLQWINVKVNPNAVSE